MVMATRPTRIFLGLHLPILNFFFTAFFSKSFCFYDKKGVKQFTPFVVNPLSNGICKTMNSP